MLSLLGEFAPAVSPRAWSLHENAVVDLKKVARAESITVSESP
jgi:hypothetical protein